MKYLAILKDSWLEALDRKSLYAMFVLSALLILFVGGFSFSETDPAAAIQELTQSFATVTLVRPPSPTTTTYKATFKVEGVKKLGADAGKFEDGFAFTLTVSPVAEFHKAVRHWDAIRRGLIRKAGDAVPDLESAADEDLETKFFIERYFDKAMVRREVKRTSADAGRQVYDVRIKPSGTHTIEGAHRIVILYGLWTKPLTMSVATWLFLMQKLLSEWVAGLAGILIALCLTAGAVPSMLQKGFVDVLVSKPIHRSSLLAWKYAGGLTYATLTGAVFIGGSWLVMSARAGVWNWGYLATLGTLILFFAVLYSIGVLAAVLTRSTIAAIAVPSGAWLLGSAVNKLHEIAVDLRFGWEMPDGVIRALDVISWFLPRAGDINQVNDYFMKRGSFGGELFDQSPAEAFAWMPVLGSSFLFIAVMLSLACWIFSRRDY